MIEDPSGPLLPQRQPSGVPEGEGIQRDRTGAAIGGWDADLRDSSLSPLSPSATICRPC